MATIGLEITTSNPDEWPDAKLVFKHTQALLKALRSVEVDMTGKKARLKWTVDMVSVRGRCIVKLNTYARSTAAVVKGDIEDEVLALKVAASAFNQREERAEGNARKGEA